MNKAQSTEILDAFASLVTAAKTGDVAQIDAAEEHWKSVAPPNDWDDSGDFDAEEAWEQRYGRPPFWK